MKTILILAANPSNTPRLRLDEEVREMTEGLWRSKDRSSFKLEQRWAVRPSDLQRALQDLEPHIVHFSGHGVGENGVQLENSSGNAISIPSLLLSQLFSLFPKIECVVLNACYSEIQASAIVEHIECVIGMDARIGDQHAIRFAISFYDAVCAGKTYQHAFEVANVIMQMDGASETTKPILKLRSKILRAYYPPGLVNVSFPSEEQLIEDLTNTDVVQIQKSKNFIAELGQTKYYQNKLFDLYNDITATYKRRNAIIKAFESIGYPDDFARKHASRPSDEETIKELLASNIHRIQQCVEFIIRAKETAFFQDKLLELFEQEEASFQHRITICRALAYLGDPRDFDEMILISEGNFYFGSDVAFITKMAERYNYYSMQETPLRQRKLPAFLISKYPVTNLQYARFLKAMPGYPTPTYWKNEEFPQELANHPVTQINWYDAMAYAAWRGGRLPTEMEWEKASRGENNWQYPWGNEFEPDRCNVALGINTTTAVGVFRNGISPYGVVDMTGNVWEWTISKHEAYEGYSGPENEFDIYAYILRGGSYSNARGNARCTSRNPERPINKYTNVGFRIVQSAKQD